MSVKPEEQLPSPPSEAEPEDDSIIGVALIWSLVVFGMLGVAGGGVAYFLLRENEETTTVEAEFVPPAVRDTTDVQIPDLPLVDVTQQAGIGFRHESGSYGDKLLPETMGGGCAIFDYDGDNDNDLLLVNSSRWPWDPRPDPVKATMKLYRNDGDWKFTDVTDDAGLALTFYGMGVAVADFDNDGDRDLYFTAVGPNRLLRNDGGRFVDVSEQAGVAGDAQEWSTSAAFLDFDNDGHLDLFVCNYVQWSKEIDLAQGFKLIGVGRAFGPPTAFRGTHPYLFRNLGNGTFQDVSAEMGVQVANAATGQADPVAKSLAVAPIDVDRDGWIDIVVANDTVQNFLFHNQQGKKFEEKARLSGIAFDDRGTATGAMGIDTGYFRNDKTLGIAIGNFANEMSSLYVSMEQPMLFYDAAVATGLGPPTRLELTFGLFFSDIDLDGRLDMVGANGHLEEEISKVQSSQRYAQPPQLFWNSGGRGAEFVRVGEDRTGTDFSQPMVGRGAAFGDLDGDGDLDLVLTACGGTPRVLRNDQQLGHHWLRCKLLGKSTNRDAIGGWIDVYCGGQVMSRQVMPTRSYLSQCELPVTIGLGDQTKVDRVVVRWPGGGEDEIVNPAVDQLLTIEQSVVAQGAAEPVSP